MSKEIEGANENPTMAILQIAQDVAEMAESEAQSPENPIDAILQIARNVKKLVEGGGGGTLYNHGIMIISNDDVVGEVYIWLNIISSSNAPLNNANLLQSWLTSHGATPDNDEYSYPAACNFTNGGGLHGGLIVSANGNFIATIDVAEVAISDSTALFYDNVTEL